MQNDIKNKEDLLDYLQKIKKLKTILNENTKTLIDESYKILECYKLFNGLKNVKVVKFYSKKIIDKRNLFLSNLSSKIVKCIFEGEEKSSNDLKSIFVIDCLKELDHKLAKIAEYKIFNDIQKIIQEYDASEKWDCDNFGAGFDRCKFYVAKKLNLYCKKIIRNFENICEFIFGNYKSEENFFEKDFGEFEFFDKKIFVDKIKTQIWKFLNVFLNSKNEESKTEFILDDIEDKIDYQKLSIANYEPEKEGVKDLRHSTYSTYSGYSGYGITNLDKESTLSFNEHKNSLVADYDFVYFIYIDIFDEMKSELKEVLDKKFFSKKEILLNKKLLKLKAKFLVAKKGKLIWYDKFVDLIKENSFYEPGFNFKTIYNSFKFVLECLNESFYLLYKNNAIKNFLDLKNNVIDLKNGADDNNFDSKRLFEVNFLNKLYEFSIEFEELQVKRNNYSVYNAANKTITNCKNVFVEEIKKFEVLEMNLELEKMLKDYVKIECKYKIAFQLQIVVDIYFYFDVYCKENTFGANNNSYICIIEIIRSISILDLTNDFDLNCVFALIKDFVFKNIKKLNIRNKNDAKLFVADLKFLEEIVCNFEMSPIDNFDQIYAFFDNCITDKPNTENEKIFCRKLHNEN